MTLDPDSLRYQRYWEPVLAGPARRALARIEATPSVFLDLGAGCGGLALDAARRWRLARIVALDASAAMLSVGEHRLMAERPEDIARFEWLVADALAMPLADASVDAAASTFVLSLVDDRPALLREMWRVLRPGGTVALVAWLADELIVAADDVFEGLVADRGWAQDRSAFRPARTTDYRSLDEAEKELIAAGFSQVDVGADELRYHWTPDAYLAFKEEYDERDLFVSLDDVERERFRDALRMRWASLPGSAFEVHGPLVSAVACRPLGE